jgi:hypothetical protein
MLGLAAAAQGDFARLERRAHHKERRDRKPGVAIEAAQADLAAVADGLAGEMTRHTMLTTARSATTGATQDGASSAQAVVIKRTRTIRSGAGSKIG